MVHSLKEVREDIAIVKKKQAIRRCRVNGCVNQNSPEEQNQWELYWLRWRGCIFLYHNLVKGQRQVQGIQEGIEFTLL
jgi:hypothetical protein